MKTIFRSALIAAVAISFAACTTTNTNVNTPASNANANAAKSTAAAPTKDSLLALEKQANDAYLKHDTKFFEGFLNDKFTGFGKTGRWTRDSVLKEIADNKCIIKDDFKLEDPQMTMVGPDVAVLVYKATFDGTCEGQKFPSPVRAASVFVRKGDKWLGAYHSESPIVDPKAPPPAKAPDKKPADTKTAESKPVNTTESKPAPDPMKDALLAIEKSGWEAWKARDAKKLEEITTKDITFVNEFGSATTDKASTIKAWTEPKCEIKSVNVTDGESISLTSDVAILTYKGTADGTCDGGKLGSLWGATVYMKDGDTWKGAFIVEIPG
jgi:ketosteroid isomerase-like protein